MNSSQSVREIGAKGRVQVKCRYDTRGSDMSCISVMSAISLAIIGGDFVSASEQIIRVECNTSLLSAIDDSASNLFVIGDRRNRFAVDDNEMSYFCSMQKSWVQDIRHYIRLCIPRFSTQKIMITKLANHLRVEANQLCDASADRPTTFTHTLCLNKVSIEAIMVKWG